MREKTNTKVKERVEIKIKEINGDKNNEREKKLNEEKLVVVDSIIDKKERNI